MTFEWDENKDLINQKKHDGISFEYAARVFFDSKRIETLDEEQEQGETLEIEHLPRLDYLMSDKKHTKTKNTSSRKRPSLEDLLSENPIKDILLVGTKGTRHDYTTPAEFRIISVQGVCPTLTRSYVPPIMMCPPSEK